MLSSMTSIIPLLRKCAFLFLAFSVFGFGLQARLSQYKPFPPNPTASKISTERNSSRALKAIEAPEADQNHGVPVLFTFFRTKLRIVSTQSVTEAAEIGLADPSRIDRNGVSPLHRPPPPTLS